MKSKRQRYILHTGSRVSAVVVIVDFLVGSRIEARPQRWGHKRTQFARPGKEAMANARDAVIKSIALARRQQDQQAGQQQPACTPSLPALRALETASRT